MDRIIWNDDMDIAYGAKENFENERDFVEKVSSEHLELTGYECLVSNVRLKSCICTGEGLEAESITPLSETDIEIKNLYIVDVENTYL